MARFDKRNAVETMIMHTTLCYNRLTEPYHQIDFNQENTLCNRYRTPRPIEMRLQRLYSRSMDSHAAIYGLKCKGHFWQKTRNVRCAQVPYSFRFTICIPSTSVTWFIEETWSLMRETSWCCVKKMSTIITSYLGTLVLLNPTIQVLRMG